MTEATPNIPFLRRTHSNIKAAAILLPLAVAANMATDELSDMSIWGNIRAIAEDCPIDDLEQIDNIVQEIIDTDVEHLRLDTFELRQKHAKKYGQTLADPNKGLEDIKVASTHAEVDSIAVSFLDSIGVELDLSKRTSLPTDLDIHRKTMSDLLIGMSYIPTELIAESGFNKITIEGDPVLVEDSIFEKCKLGTASKVASFNEKKPNQFKLSQGPIKITTPAHELGHLLDAELCGPFDYTRDAASARILANILIEKEKINCKNGGKMPSVFSQTNMVEAKAEFIENMIFKNKPFPKDPDALSLYVLLAIRLDSVVPGISSYLLGLNL